MAKIKIEGSVSLFLLVAHNIHYVHEYVWRLLETGRRRLVYLTQSTMLSYLPVMKDELPTTHHPTVCREEYPRLNVL